MKPSFVIPILKRLAKKAGVKILVEPRYGYTAQIISPSGRKTYVRGTCFDVNPLGASEIAQDKAYSYFFLNSLGYPTVEGDSFFSPRWAKAIHINRGPKEALKYALRLGFPLIVKPNSLSQGSGVTLVYNKPEFNTAVRAICKKDKVFLVQKVALGRDYRVVVLDNEVISAYERLSLSVTGNGKLTIFKLLKQKQKEFKQIGRDTMLKIKDPRIVGTLKRLGLTLNSVLAEGKRIELLANRNLSSGGDAVDVTDSIHTSFKKLCINITRDMGLRYCGVDLMVAGKISDPVKKYKVIEINAAAGLDNYAAVGLRQKKKVDELYLKVLKALIKK